MGWRGRRHDWLRRYVNDGGLAGLVDRSSRPQACPHQMSAVIEARVVKLRREHPAWGPSRIVWQLERTGVAPVPGRSSVYRALVRHGLVEAAHRPTGARSPNHGMWRLWHEVPGLWRYTGVFRGDGRAIEGAGRRLSGRMAVEA